MPIRNTALPICAFLLHTFTAALGQSGGFDGSAASSLLGKAVPGRFIMVYREGARAAESSPQFAAVGARVLRTHDLLGMSIVQIPLGDAASSTATQHQLALVPGVEFVIPDRMVYAHAVVVRPAVATSVSQGIAADSLYRSQQGWAVRQVGGFGSATLPGSGVGPWNITTGAGIRIAILDSGIDANHPDLAPNLAFNLSEVDQNALPSPCDDGSPQDQQGHGSWAASLAAGALGEGTGLVAGVAPSATLLNIKVLERLPSLNTSASDPTGCIAGQASGLLSWVIAGIQEAVRQRADVISMSLGTLVDVTTGDGAGLKAAFDRVTHAAAQAGVILIAAAGNDGFNLNNPRYLELPAQARDVLAMVASTNPSCAEDLTAGARCAPGPITLPYYSNFGSPLNALAAPGGSYPAGPEDDPAQPTGWIVGACSEGKPSTLDGPPADPAHSLGCFGLGHAAYVQAMGTSASAPLAAGVAALIRSAHPGWDAATVVAAMRASAVALTTLPVGIVNAEATVKPAEVHAEPTNAIAIAR